MQKKYFLHIIALFCVLVWGTTFVSTKVLLQHGLDPSEIFIIRFALAWVLIIFFSPKKLFANSIKDELLLAALGFTGGSAYFLFENTALDLTQTSNVAFIVCSTPIFTALLVSKLYKKEPLPKGFYLGSVFAMIGVAFVVYSGNFVLKLSFWGELLAILAALMWGAYGLIIKFLDKKYSTVFITRKIFFYGLITILPWLIFHPIHFNVDLLIEPVVLWNLLYLGSIASLVCFFAWNYAVKRLGVIYTTNYLYLNPFVTFITSLIFLDEKITVSAVIGSLLIICGVYLSENKIGRKK
jgi:drug/metabolite transporter (DMT)-like permease